MKKILVAICLLLVIANIITLLRKNNAVKTYANHLYPLIDPAREFISQDKFVTNIQPLRDYLHELEMQYPDTISIYYEQLNSGANISVNKNLRLFPASLSKLALGLIVAKKVEDGTWSWDKKLDHTSADLSSDSGEFYKTIGTGTTTVEKLVEELLVNSDNTAQNILLRNVEIPGDYTLLQEKTGLDDLYDEQGFISAKEYSRMLRILYTSSFMEREYSEKILELMASTSFHDYLSQGIPDGVKFAHKYGENKEQSIFADSGIVYDNGTPYLITVMLKGKDSTDATRQWAVDLMKEISEKAYE